MKFIYLFCLYLVFLSCDRKDEALEYALELSGNNRSELEKVLKHYSNDSCKLEAAKFLIRNMPGHYSIVKSKINDYKRILLQDVNVNYFGAKVFEIVSPNYININQNVSFEDDITSVSSEYLINHIDKSFELMNSRHWLKDLPFDIFFEYILPYRFKNEVYDYWIDSLQVLESDIESIKYKDDSYSSILNIKLFNDLKLQTKTDLPYHEVVELTKENVFKDCYSISYADLVHNRSKGIPAALDFFPFYSNRNGYHHWITIISPEHRISNVKEVTTRKTGKIYRKTYSHNKIPIPLKDEYIPTFFCDPFNKDVTDLYLSTADFSIPIKEKFSEKVNNAYLCVFSNLKWEVIGYGTINNKKAEFKNYGKGNVYSPIVFQDAKRHVINYPFILDNRGDYKFIIPDTNHLQNLKLTRKHPFKSALHGYYEDLYGMIFEASNDKNFNSIELTVQMDNGNHQFLDQMINHKNRCRYWRVNINPDKTYQIAELIFYGIEGDVINFDAPTTHKKICDNNPLTYNWLDIKEDFFVIDFKQPVEISRIVCLPRGDGNGVYPNNIYELLYYDLTGWNSLGVKEATDFYLEYNSVPTNALFWLRNHTIGMEERIFTVEDGHVRFW